MRSPAESVHVESVWPVVASEVEAEDLESLVFAENPLFEMDSVRLVLTSKVEAEEPKLIASFEASPSEMESV